jgi:hypothetical protein
MSLGILQRLRQRQHALTLPQWAWTLVTKGLVWQELQDAIDEIEHLRAELAQSADSALGVWNRAIKAETRCRELELQVARLTLRSSDALDSVNGGGTRGRRAAAVADVDARRDAQPSDVPQGARALQEHETVGVH